jgi:hypothetical protein
MITKPEQTTDNPNPREAKAPSPLRFAGALHKTLRPRGKPEIVARLPQP